MNCWIRGCFLLSMLTCVPTAAMGAPASLQTSLGRVLSASVERLLSQGTVEVRHFDHLGTGTLATGGSGEVLGRQRFSAYGAVQTTMRGSGMPRFTGNKWEGSTGAYHFLYRDLDPGSGRWLSPDPLFLRFMVSQAHKYGEATTSYAYVGNRVPNESDPNGLGVMKQLGRLKGRLVRKPARQRAARARCANGVCYERSIAESYLGGGLSGKAYDRLNSSSTRQPQIVDAFRGGTVIQSPTQLGNISAGDFVVFDRQTSGGMRAAHWMYSLGGGQAVSNNNSMVLTASNMQDVRGNRITLNEFSFDSSTQLFKRTQKAPDGDAFRIRVVSPAQVTQNLGL